MQISIVLKVLIQAPTKELFHFLQKKLIYHNIEIFYLTRLSDLENFSQRINPDIIILYIDADPGKYRFALQTLQRLTQQSKAWFILLVHPQVDAEKLHSDLPNARIFVFPADSDFHQLAHNLLFVRDVYQNIGGLKNKVIVADNFNYCLKIIQQERQLPELFERLVNYLPKIVMMDYWAIFTTDATMQSVRHFTQFIPPTRRRQIVLTHHLEQLSYSWLIQGRSFSLSSSDDPQLFQKLAEWGWPVKRISFIPLKIKNRTIGGILVGSLTNRNLLSQEVLLLNDLANVLAEKILNVYLQETTIADFKDFSDQLIQNRFSEEAVFFSACKIINDYTKAHSTIYWQINKGFGFLFPKYFYFRQEANKPEDLEKNVIFLSQDMFFNRLLQQGKNQIIQRETHFNRFSESTRQVFQKLAYQNVLIYPIVVFDEVNGLLAINREDPSHNFSVWEIHRIEEVIQRVQKVLEDTQVVRDAQLKLRQLSRIFELGNELKLELSLPDVLKRIADNLRKSLGWNDIAFMLLDEIKKTLHLQCRVGFDNTEGMVVDFSKPIPLEKLQLILSRCEKINNAYFYNSGIPEESNGGLQGTPASIEWKEKDLLIIPLETRKKILGYLLVRDPVDRLKPTSEKLIPLEYYANQAAIAVENTHLYEKLLASEERYRTLAETMSLGLVTCNLQGKIVYVNPAFQRLLGQTNTRLVNKALKEYFTPRSQNKYQEIMEKLVSTDVDEKTRIENVELELVGEDAEPIPVSVFAFPFFQRKEKVGYFLVLNDLRVVKRLERMKADFNSMIVHDLRSPMNVIQGFIELIRNRVVGDINDEQAELLDIAKENVKKVLMLIDNFLVASKMEIGKFSIEPKLNEINSLIERVVENHRVLTQNKKIKIHLELDRNLPLIFFDSLRVEQVLNNLLSNAMKFTPEGGDIFIRSSLFKKTIKGEEKFFAKITVEDTGMGIPPDKLEHIFEKYEQSGVEKKINEAGTGLGLAICKEIVNLHGGEIWAESEPNKGSAFHFTFPIEPSVEKIVK